MIQKRLMKNPVCLLVKLGQSTRKTFITTPSVKNRGVTKIVVGNYMRVAIVIVALSSCATDDFGPTDYEWKHWQAKKVSKNLRHIDPSEEILEAIERVMQNYRHKPLDVGYEELKLDEIVENDAGSRIYAFFYIRHVEDIQVVVEMDRKGILIDNYLISLFSPYEDLEKMPQLCPCGYLGDRFADCNCNGDRIAAYRRKISGLLFEYEYECERSGHCS